MSATQNATEPRTAGVSLNIAIHPELRRDLKIAATQDDMTMVEKLHAILCAELNRLDLIHQPPKGQ